MNVSPLPGLRVQKTLVWANREASDSTWLVWQENFVNKHLILERVIEEANSVDKIMEVNEGIRLSSRPERKALWARG